MNNKFENIDKKARIMWILYRLLFLIPVIIVELSTIVVDEMPQALKIALYIMGGILFVAAVFYIFIFPFLQYKKYLYMIKDDEIVIMRGVLFKYSVVIPIVQIQDIGYSERPLEQIFKLSTIVISTAGSTQIINCVEKEKARSIVDNIKEKVKEYIKKRDGAK